MQSFDESLRYNFKDLTKTILHLEKEMAIVTHDQNNTIDETRYCRRLSSVACNNMTDCLNKLETQRKRLWWIPNSHFSIQELKFIRVFKADVYKTINEMYAYIDL